MKNGDVNVFEETNRTSQYVELSNIVSAVVVGLEDKRDFVKLGNQPFKVFFTGKWKQNSFDLMKTAEAREQEAKELAARIRSLGK